MLSSCEKFEGDQTIPAYLKIDSISFAADYSTWGSSSHSITDAWVYVDGEFIGAFPLPADFPVLKQGAKTVKILAGIKKDGIAATRISYPFYSPIEKTVNLVPDVHTTVTGVSSTYDSRTNILWQEDFELAGDAITLDTTSRSSVAIKKTPAGSPLTFERLHSGIIQMDSAGDFFECVSNKSFNIPYASVFLELDFNTNNSLTVQVNLFSGSIRYQVPVMVLVDTGGKWKKIYIDLTNSLASVAGATKFQVVFGNYKDESVSQARILLDNIKLLTTNTAK